LPDECIHTNTRKKSSRDLVSWAVCACKGLGQIRGKCVPHLPRKLHRISATQTVVVVVRVVAWWGDTVRIHNFYVSNFFIPLCHSSLISSSSTSKICAHKHKADRPHACRGRNSVDICLQCQPSNQLDFYIEGKKSRDKLSRDPCMPDVYRSFQQLYIWPSSARLITKGISP
jgi:hypothetical protein